MSRKSSILWLWAIALHILPHTTALPQNHAIHDIHFRKKIIAPTCKNSVSYVHLPHPRLEGEGDCTWLSALRDEQMPGSSAMPTSCWQDYRPFDYSAKRQSDLEAPICPLIPGVSLIQRSIEPRAEDDYSCSESKPCKNGACCPKATGYCNYGEKYCGTNGQSPNEVCWSNCNAKAECGRDADPPGKKCPLNVCCSKYGYVRNMLPKYAISLWAMSSVWWY